MRIQEAQTLLEETKYPDQSDILAQIRARRGAAGLLELDHILLHSLPLAAGWHSFFGAIRTETLLPADVGEVAICRVAAINHAWYEWKHHEPLARAAGVTEAAMDSVLRGSSHGLTATLQLVMKYTEAMTKNISVDEHLFQDIRAVFGTREVIELTMTIAAYNCVSRFLVALDIGDCNDQSPKTYSGEEGM